MLAFLSDSCGLFGDFMKNILRISTVIALTSYSISAYSIGDLIGGVGYSSYKYNDNNSFSTENGYNLNASLLLSLLGVNPIASIVIGPKLKYESVSASSTVNSYTQKETFSTTQVGAEGGIKINIIPSISLYGTAFATYGISNTLAEDISGGGPIIPDQTVNPTVSKSWQMGADARGFFNLNSVFGIGGGVEFIRGSYAYDSSTINTNAGTQSVEGRTNSYSATNFNLLIALYL